MLVETDQRFVDRTLIYSKKRAVYVEKVCRKFQYVLLAYG